MPTPIPAPISIDASLPTATNAGKSNQPPIWEIIRPAINVTNSPKAIPVNASMKYFWKKALMRSCPFLI